MEPMISQCRYLLALAEPILAGLDDSHRALEPQIGTKTAGWLIGTSPLAGTLHGDCVDDSRLSAQCSGAPCSIPEPSLRTSRVIILE